MSDGMRKDLLKTLNNYSVADEHPPYVIPLLEMNELKGCGIVESIMAWASRWSGRPSKEQVEKALTYFGTLGLSHIYREILARHILELYPAPSPRVSREDIRKTVIRNVSEIGSNVTLFETYLVDDLCRLIGIEDRPKVWCQHLEYVEKSNGHEKYGEWEVKSQQYPDGKCSPSWTLYGGKFCPICSAPRPA